MAAPRNRTLTLSATEEKTLKKKLLTLTAPATPSQIENKTICQDLFEAVAYLPAACVDLLFVDPPYNLTKTFGAHPFKARGSEAYQAWVASWLAPLQRTLKKTASVYLCGDWRSAAALFGAASEYFILRNRITFEREKGRGASRNWKSSCEDVWFATVSKDYFFNAAAVKLKRRVLAPYCDAAGKAKDWHQESQAQKERYRLTHPSNFWSDLTIPFWSMSENTQHPTQKPEKLLAKIILASSKPGDLMLDPFLGAGTSSVVAKKLGRRYVGIEKESRYCCLAEKRLQLAETDQRIQGYEGGVFWERNSAPK